MIRRCYLEIKIECADLAAFIGVDPKQTIVVDGSVSGQRVAAGMYQ
jgi:hypothetical protein